MQLSLIQENAIQGNTIEDMLIFGPYRNYRPTILDHPFGYNAIQGNRYSPAPFDALKPLDLFD